MQRCGGCKIEKPLDDFSPSHQGKLGTWCKGCHSAYNKGERISVSYQIKFDCLFCKKPYTPKQIQPSRSNAFCSRKCKDDFKNERRRTTRLQSKDAVLRNCIWCSSDIPSAMRMDAKFCTVRCNNAAHQAIRKLAIRNGTSRNNGFLGLRTMLVERDGLMCSLCDKELSLLIKHPDPCYASIDHVIPLARGGTNDFDNLALAHLVCNVRKKDRILISL